MTHGWFESLVERTGKKYLSYSSIKYALQDIALFELYMQGKLKKDSPALAFGSAYDCLLFTPELFDEQFHVFDDREIVQDIGGRQPRSTKVYKDWMAEQKKLSVDKTAVSFDDYQQCIDMITRLDESGVQNIYLDGNYQVEFNHEIELFGDVVPFRGFLDCLGDGYISDSKSSRSVKGFKRDVVTFGYDIQAFLYTHVFGIKDFYWVVQEKAYPFYPADVKCSEETLFRGEMKFHQALENIQKYLNEKQRSEEHFAEFIV